MRRGRKRTLVTVVTSRMCKLGEGMDSRVKGPNINRLT